MYCVDIPDETYHYNYTEGVSYPHGKRAWDPWTAPGSRLPSSGHLLSQGLVTPEHTSNRLFGENLQSLSRQTDANLERLKKKLVQFDPCYAYGVEHWHPNERQSQEVVVENPLNNQPSNLMPKWTSGDSMFTNRDKVHREFKKPPKKSSDDTPADGGPVNKYCYLCTTLEEHQKHIAKRGRQLKEKKKPKPRVEFIAPPPYVKPKEKEVVEEKHESLFKVVVKTGKKPNAGTSANVFVQLRGQKGETKRQQLKKNLAVSFAFGHSTSESFYIKGPNIGNLKSIIIEHDGLEKKHCWFLEEVEVTDMNTQQIYVFLCHDWLSLFHGNYKLKKHLRAQEKEIQQDEFVITVVTGDKRFAGTDANVFVTLYGKKGVSRKSQLRDKSRNNFERGNKDSFQIVTDDIGPLTRLKIEHDNSGAAAGWLLEKVLVESLNTGRTLMFPCGQWLEDEGALFKILYPGREGGTGRGHHGGRDDPDDMHTGRRKGKLGDEDTHGDSLTYQVTVITGNLRHAGTDANVYMTMYGKAGVAKEVELDDEKNNFERNMTDVFKIKGEDVGDLKKIRIRHDNSGLGAGWFLQKIIIRRFFSKQEVRDRIVEMQDTMNDQIAERASQITGEPMPVTDRRKSLKHTGSMKMNTSDRRQSKSRGSVRWEEDQSGSDSEDSAKKNRRKPKKRKGRQKKKRYAYGEIEVWVTDASSQSEDDEDSEEDEMRRGGRRSSKHRQRRDNDSDSDDDSMSKRRHQDKSQEEEDRKHKKRYSSIKVHTHRDLVPDSVTDTDSEGDRRSRRRRKGKEQEQVIPQKGRVPLCDEYVFPCEKWLATDEDDGQLERTLKPGSVTTFYKVQKDHA